MAVTVVVITSSIYYGVMLCCVAIRKSKYGEFVNMRVTWYGGCSTVIKTDGVSNAQWRSRSYHLQSIRTIEVEDCSNAKVSRMMMDLVG